MLVILCVTMVMPVVIMIMAILPAPCKAAFGFLGCIHTIHQCQYLHTAGIHRRKHISHPFIRFPTNVEEHITVLYRYDVLRGRLVTVYLRAWLQQHFYLGILSRYLPGKIIQRKNRCYNLYFLGLLL